MIGTVLDLLLILKKPTEFTSISIAAGFVQGGGNVWKL